ncbi:flagellar motor protein MotB [Marinomonas pollencensis]|uniref:Chemotaxis protein MotB n=1 Tax=Marinomonas pollencensis TaxID=491954 RepID=A0A3E0DII0_9GAMM|nr:flagellar motor protein MotB [Marinomonas pollencensis]REG81618.1 chemotaxis protein MotB [Marinomonas pollencensis]
MAIGSGNIIIRRVKKVKKGGHHGGAWKIALADFALAMMAFFLVLWVINVASPEELVTIQGYFNDPLGQSTSGFSAEPIDLGGSPAKSTEKKLDLDLPDPGSTKELNKQQEKARDDAQKEREEMNRVLQADLKKMNLSNALMNNIRIEITPQGVRITLLDDPDKPMFERGSAQFIPDFENMLLSMAPIFANVSNPITITGHTDSVKFGGDGLDNWDLSSRRANAARRILEEGGVNDRRIAQVIGLSDTVPYNRVDPNSPENRRISITLLTDSAYKELLARNRLNYGPVGQQDALDLSPEAVF